MKKRYILYALILLSACKSDRKIEESVPDLAENQTIEISTLQQKEAGLEIGKVDTGRMSLSIQLNAYLENKPGAERSISSPIPGIIRDIKHSIGSELRKGETLCRLESMQLPEMQKSYLQAKARRIQSEKDNKRQGELAAEMAGSTKAYELAKANYESDLSEEMALKNQLEQLRALPENATQISRFFTISVPERSYLTNLSVKEGEYVESGKNIAEIQLKDATQLRLIAFEDQFSLFEIGSKVSVKDKSGNSYNAVIGQINPKINADRSFEMIAGWTEKPLAYATGSFIQAEVSMHTKMGIILPSDAVIQRGDRYYGFIQTAAQEFRQIELNIEAENECCYLIPYTQEYALSNWVKKNAFALFLSHHKSGE